MAHTRTSNKLTKYPFKISAESVPVSAYSLLTKNNMTFYNNYFNDWEKCNLMVRLNVNINMPPNGEVQLSPFVPVFWPSDAKAVEDTQNGIWGYDLERMNTNIMQLMNQLYTTYCFQDGWLVILDYDIDSCRRIPTEQDLSNPLRKLGHGIFTNELIATKANIMLMVPIKGRIDFKERICAIMNEIQLMKPEYTAIKKGSSSRRIITQKPVQIIRWKNNANEIQLLNFLLNEPQKKGKHGYEHSQRVEAFGCLLAQEATDSDIDVIRWFAYIHDYKKMNDYEIDHGQRAAKYIDTIRESYLINLSEYQIKLLKDACFYHAIKHKTGDITIDICFDADRLDLPRTGIKVDTNKLATKIARKYSQIGYEELCKQAGTFPKSTNLFNAFAL